ncbi:hypothetical protein XELAEV_18042110mg [Xenopus laevis]|uniref:Uncharacterized protein n=1 Tax=Xenopus laevis TaxID=8355 RepID=A0A974C3H1_XENLA|nr:hypothetical protein XELAEV_18042110mg [Xenopus laevis]
MTFAYTNEDVIRITGAVKGNSEFLSQSDIICDLKDLERLQRKKVAWDLHSMTLAEYVKVQRIPRGLRSHLRPTMFGGDEAFRTKWESILNKCSFDLMVALLEQIQKETPSVSALIVEKEQKMRNQYAERELSEGLTKLTDSIAAFRATLEIRKREKFRRDAEDYSAGTIYKWRNSQEQRQPTLREYTRTRMTRNETGERSAEEQARQRGQRSTVPTTAFLSSSQTSLNTSAASGEEAGGQRTKEKKYVKKHRPRRW